MTLILQERPYDPKVLEAFTRLSVAPSMSSLYYQLYKDSEVDVGHCATARSKSKSERSFDSHRAAYSDPRRDLDRSQEIGGREGGSGEGVAAFSKLRSCNWTAVLGDFF